MRHSQCHPLLQFRSWCVFPPFVRGLAGTAIALVLLMVCLPLSHVARRDGHCSGLTGGAFPLCARLSGKGIAPIRLMVWSSFCARLAGTAVALVSLMVFPHFHAQLSGTTIPPVLLMVLAPFM